MLVSIIVSTYNASKTIEKSIKSILSQSSPDWECIIIDNGSTDDTVKKVSGAAGDDKRIKIVQKYHTSDTDNVNVGLQLAKGKFICLSDGCSEINKGLFERCAYEMENSKLDMVMYGVRIGKKDFLPSKFSPELYTVDCGAFYRKSLLRKIGMCIPSEYPLPAFTLRLMCYDKCKTGYIDCVLASISNTSETRVNVKGLISLKKNLQSLGVVTWKSEIEQYLSKEIDLRDDTIDYVIDYDEYVNRIDLRMKLRAIEKWMPWIDTVWVLINKNQPPVWLNTENVRIVNYKDFIPSEYLPTSNPKTAQMFGFMIKDIARKFIWSNDHCLPNCTLKDKFFYTNNYRSVKLKFTEFDFLEPNVSPMYKMTLMNDLSLATRGTNGHGMDISKIMYEIQYTDRALIKEHCEAAFNEHKEQILKSISPERESYNLSINFYSEYDYTHYNGENDTFKYTVINADESPDYVWREVTTKRLDMRYRSIALRITDSFDEINDILAGYYKIKSKYER